MFRCAVGLARPHLAPSHVRSPLLLRTRHLVVQSQSRPYVTSTGRRGSSAAVSVDISNQEIDTRNFVNKTGGLKPSEVGVGGGGLTADAMMSPSAGRSSLSVSVLIFIFCICTEKMAS